MSAPSRPASTSQADRVRRAQIQQHTGDVFLHICHLCAVRCPAEPDSGEAKTSFRSHAVVRRSPFRGGVCCHHRGLSAPPAASSENIP